MSSHKHGAGKEEGRASCALQVNEKLKMILQILHTFHLFSPIISRDIEII